MSSWLARWRALLPQTEENVRRFVQGRAFQRSGRVTAVRVSPGRLSGRVQGSRATPYLVEALLPVLGDRDWVAVVEAISAQVRHTARLLAGQPPEGLEEDLADHGVDLFGSHDHLDARCPCGEADRSCSHLFALWEEAGERFTADPFALLHLRGRGREHLLAELAAARRRARGAEDELGIDLAALDTAGWTRSPVPLGHLDFPEGDLPETTAGPLRVLGDPPGWAGSVSAYELFAPMVDRAAERARDLDGTSQRGCGNGS